MNFDKTIKSLYAIPKPMFSYQNLTDYPQIIPNVGIVPPNGTIQTDQEVNNQNLKRIIEKHAEQPQLVQAAPERVTEGE